MTKTTDSTCDKDVAGNVVALVLTERGEQMNDTRLLEPGWAGVLDEDELAFIQGQLLQHRELALRWGFRPSRKTRPPGAIRLVALRGASDDLKLNRRLARWGGASTHDTTHDDPQFAIYGKTSGVSPVIGMPGPILVVLPPRHGGGQGETALRNQSGPQRARSPGGWQPSARARGHGPPEAAHDFCRLQTLTCKVTCKEYDGNR